MTGTSGRTARTRLEHVQPVAVGQHEVQKDEVEVERHPEADGVGGGRRALHRVSLGGEPLHDE